MIRGEVERKRRTPRARRRDASVERILDEALELIRRDGLDGLSMARLAEAADYTPGALYRYFDSKDAILSRLVERALVDVRAGLDRALAALGDGAPAVDRIVALTRAYRDFARRDPHRFGLLALTLAEPRVLLTHASHSGPAAGAMLDALQPLAVTLAAAATAGELSAGSAGDRCMTLFAALHGALQLAKLVRHAPTLDVDRLAREATRGLLLGWGADPAALDAALAAADARPTATTTTTTGASA